MKNKNKTSLKNALNINFKSINLLYKEDRGLVISTILNAVFSSVFTFVIIYLSAYLVEQLTVNNSLVKLNIILVVVVSIIACLSLIFAIIKKWFETKTNNLYYKVEKIYTNKLFEMDFQSLDDIATHELLSTIRENQNGGGWGLFRSLNDLDSLFSSLTSILFSILLTFSLFQSQVPSENGKYLFLNNNFFILGFIVIMIFLTLVSPFFTYKGVSYYAKYSNMHNLGNRLYGFYGWLGSRKDIATDVRIYRQDIICDKYNCKKDDIFSSNGLFAKLSKGPIGLYSILASIINSLFIGLVFTFVCLKSWAGAFGIGLIMQYTSSSIKLLSSLNVFVNTIGDMKINSSFLKLIFDFLNIPNNMYKGSLTVEKRLDKKYEIEFKNVSFKYQTSTDYILKNINIKFKIGSKLAIVGENGSGKTTFIKLLCRLYDPTEGEILLNGIDIKKYNYDEYLEIFSVVFQDFKLLSFKLGENVAASTMYKKEKVIECLIKSSYEVNLDKLSEGLNTYLYKDISEDGVNISGGESQKIALARALYKDSAFIILDEPTASLDPIAEAEIYAKFNEIVTNKTAVYISHRLSSCMFCDEVIVFNNGEIIEYDTPKKLLANKDSKYYELWNAQAQYYK